MSQSRTLNSFRNVIVSIVTQLMIILINFFVRTLFIKTLGTEILGLNGLYANILQLLSVFDMGINTAILFALYKPLAEKDYGVLGSLIMYLKQVYMRIAGAIAFIGLLFIPFLSLVVKADIPIHLAVLYYLVFMFNSIASYYNIHWSVLLIADQRNYIVKLYSFVFQVIKSVLQVVSLLVMKSYIAFLGINLIITIINNQLVAIHSRKTYPIISDDSEKLDIDIKKELHDNIKSVFIYRLGALLLNSTDNIIISVILGTVYVGYYSNYNLLTGSAITLLSFIFSSLSSSIGNLNTKVSENSLSVFFELNFLCFWLYGVTSIGVYLLINDFIVLWLGHEYLLSDFTVVAIVINIYMPGILRSVSIYRDTTGLFKLTRYIFLITATINILLSIVLGHIWGLEGILFATAISRLLTNWWIEPYMLFRHFFMSSINKYVMRQIGYIVFLLIYVILFKYVFKMSMDVSIGLFIFKTVVLLISFHIALIVSFRNTDEFKCFSSRLLNIVRQIR